MKTALIIDDEEEMIELLGDVLSRAGFEIISAQNGMDGLELLQQRDFDVIVCDVLMPKLGGAELFQRIEKEKPWLVNHFIFISGHSWMSGATDFISRTGARYVEKPLSIDKLLRAVDSILQLY